VNDRHFGRELGEERRLFYRRVPAADYDQLSVLEKEYVAGRARRHPMAHELHFRLDSQKLGGRAGRDNQSLAGVAFLSDHYLERPLFQIHKMVSSPLLACYR